MPKVIVKTVASYEFEPEGEDAVKVNSIASVAELEKQKADEEKAQLNVS
jgi:hypothetical protein